MITCLAWYEQTIDGRWVQHVIDKASLVAWLTLRKKVDLNGVYGQPDLITGKRYFAHQRVIPANVSLLVSTGTNGASCLPTKPHPRMAA